MGLETITSTTSNHTIADLNVSWPLAGDAVSEGAAHLRNIKRALELTFINLSATVSSVAAELDLAHKGGTVSGSLVVLGTLTVSGSVKASGRIDVGGALSVGGAVTFTDDLTVSGTSVFKSDVSIGGQLKIATALALAQGGTGSSTTASIKPALGIFVGEVLASGTAGPTIGLPSGWTSELTLSSVIKITHSLGVGNLVVNITPRNATLGNNYFPMIRGNSNDYFYYQNIDLSAGTAGFCAVDLVVIKQS